MKESLSAESLLQRLIEKPPAIRAGGESIVEWYHQVRLNSDLSVSDDLDALTGGFYANSVGQAFVYGYEVAIQRLTGLDTKEQLAAFCVTENKSTHPQSMQVSLIEEGDKLLLSGKKDFVTLASDTKWLLVAAKFGILDSGRNQIKLIKVDASLPGVNIKILPPLPFIPEVGHGVVTFDSVSIDQRDLFLGDGYGDYVKPFRWIEDINVFISLSGYLLKIALVYQWPLASRVEIISILTSLLGMLSAGANEPIAHIAFYDQVARLERWLEQYDDAWQSVDVAVSAAWKRDRGLLKIASYARSARYKKALSRLALV